MTITKHGLFGRSRGADMTQGNIASHIISFAIPLLLGNLFQQLYNTVDTWVIGNYASNEAFAAVGSVGPIVNMLIGTFSGLSSGAGVVISQYYGAKDEKRVSEAVHSSVVMTLILSVLFTVFGTLASPLLLRLMKTPTDVFPESNTYLTIYVAGITGLLIYNMGAGILRAIGDSTRPFLYLVVSAITNIVLDLLFVIKFNLGVAGVAYATIISQGLSAILVIVTLFKTSSCVKISLRKIKIHIGVLSKIIKVGIPAALQMAITAFSNVFVQSYINAFEADFMSGWTAYIKIDGFLFLPMQSIALAATTFVGQNLGSNNPERAKKGVSTSITLAMGITAVVIIPILIFSPSLIAFFNDKPQVVEYGTLLLRYVSPFYVLCAINQVLALALRGAGDSKGPMIITLSSFVLFRQIYLYLASILFPGSFIVTAMGYPAGWLLCTVIYLIYYRKVGIHKNKLI